VLSHAGLIDSRREGRSIIYTAAYERMAALLGFLMEDCCGGSAAICAPLAEIVSRAACCAPDMASA
jgi:ArsR family transcriptional regulator, arsenate/arsenite/antimonite-responsive transcriptional repressor